MNILKPFDENNLLVSCGLDGTLAENVQAGARITLKHDPCGECDGRAGCSGPTKKPIENAWCLLLFFYYNGLNVQIAELFLGSRSRTFRHQTLSLLGLREGDDIANTGRSRQ